MIEIKGIEYYQEIKGEFIYMGEATTKEELYRPFIKFKNSKGKYIEIWEEANKFRKLGMLLANPYSSYATFSYEDLLFLAKTYNFDIEQYKTHADIFDGYIINEKPSFKALGEFFYIEEEGINYLMIFFRRWQFDYQPRSAGEDMLGEDITYIHGIWENPILTESILKTIKS